MDNLEKSKVKINVYYEVVKDKLIQHRLAINSEFRKRRYGEELCEFSCYGKARGFWGQEEKLPECDALGSRIPWRKTRPLEDLLNPNNKEAITKVYATDVLNHDVLLATFYLCHPRHDWQFEDRGNRDIPIFLGEGDSLKDLQKECVQSYMNGVSSQPVEVIGFYQGDLGISGHSSHGFLVPTHPYINHKDPTNTSSGLMPGIIIVPFDDEVNVQLLNCGDYKRFLERTGTEYVDEMFGQNFIYQGSEELDMNRLSEEERANALAKAQEDAPILKILKANVRFKKD